VEHQKLLIGPYLRRSISTSLANSATSAAAVALLLPLIVNLVGIATYAEWAVLILFLNTAVALDLGMTRAIVLQVSRSPPRGAPIVVAAALVVMIALILVIAALIWVCEVFGISIWGQHSFMSGESRVHLIAYGLAIVTIHLLNAVLRGALEAQLRLHVVNIGYLVQTVLYYGFAFFVALVAPHSEWLMASSVGAYAVVFCSHLIQVQKMGLLSFAGFEWVAVCQLLRVSVASYVAFAPGSLILPALGFFFIREVSEGRAFGLFDISIRITSLCSSTLSGVALPLFALTAAQGGSRLAEIGVLVRRYALATWGLYLVGMLLFWLFGRLLLEIAFRGNATLLFQSCLITLAGGGALAAAEPFTRALLGFGLVRQVFLSKLSSLTTALVAIYLLNAGPALTKYAMAYSLGCGAGAVYISLAYLEFFKKSRIPSNQNGAQWK
jgi:hypothetical protein